VKNVKQLPLHRAALEYEIERQIGVIEDGGRVVQESRLWNNAEGRTYSMRSKEQRMIIATSPSQIFAARRRRGVAEADSWRRCRSCRKPAG